MDFSALDNFLNELTHTKVPFAECRVHKCGKEVYRYAGGEKYYPNYKYYNLYSTSKVITCVAALQLLEKGKYLLTEPLAEYLPEFSEMTVKREFTLGDEGRKTAEGVGVGSDNKKYETVKCNTPILIEHLFSMTAGFDYNLNSESVKKYQKETEGKFPTRMIAKALSEEPLGFEPGTRWNYSLCHDVLGAFIEVVSGMKFSEYLKKNIFEPLGMNDTGFERNEKIYSQMFSQYLFDNETQEANEIGKEASNFVLGTEYESGGAGLISTADDYIKFADALANGGVGKDGIRILSPRTIDLMRENRLCENAMKDFNWVQLAGYGYGLGVRTMMNRGKGGAIGQVGEFGWGGAAGAYVMIDPDNNISVFYGQHMLNNLEPFIHPRIRNLVYSAF